MNTIELPALDGRLPLGFLAACGTLRLLDESTPPGSPRPLLSWDRYTGTAQLSIDSDLDGVVERLQQSARSIPPEALLPNGPPAFPGNNSPSEWPRGDPVRMPVGEFASQVRSWRAAFGDDFVDVWLPAMVTDLTEDDKACVELSPFAAPSGQQRFATMFDKPLQLVRERPELLREALVGWRRVDGVTGEYLDHHVIRSAADRSEGESIEAGVPGATWLALMALPLFPAWAGSARPLAGGWQARRRSRPLLVWPLWAAQTDVHAALSLLTHPALRIIEGGGAAPGPRVADPDALRALGVFYVGGADRQAIAGRNFAGVLTTAAVAFVPSATR